MKVFIALFLFLIATPSFATNWVEVMEKAFVDTDNVEIYNPLSEEMMYSFWVKYLNDNSEVWQQYSRKYNTEIYYSVGMQIINCNKKMVASKIFLDYDKNNRPIFREDIPDSALQWRRIIPGTIGDGMYNILCKQ